MGGLCVTSVVSQLKETGGSNAVAYVSLGLSFTRAERDIPCPLGQWSTVSLVWKLLSAGCSLGDSNVDALEKEEL